MSEHDIEVELPTTQAGSSRPDQTGDQPTPMDTEPPAGDSTSNDVYVTVYKEKNLNSSSTIRPLLRGSVKSFQNL